MSRKFQIQERETALATLDSGTIEFMKWLRSQEKDSGDTLIMVKDFLENKYVILFDRSILKDVIVGYLESMPWCTSCDRDDCGHVGFAICYKQNCDRNSQVMLS